MTHQRGCAYQLVHAVFGSAGPSSSARTAEEQDKQSPNSGFSAEHPSADNSYVILPDSFLEPTEFFTRLEQREQMLLHGYGVGGVFPPWYAASNPGSAILLAGQARIMYCEPNSVRTLGEAKRTNVFSRRGRLSFFQAQIFFPISATLHPHAMQIEVSAIFAMIYLLHFAQFATHTGLLPLLAGSFVTVNDLTSRCRILVACKLARVTTLTGIDPRSQVMLRARRFFPNYRKHLNKQTRITIPITRYWTTISVGGS